uniref:Uncharacterized protein n=1 Tax=Oryza glaberrima TaxID=4538 RepID=I1Q707_ORYGL
MALGSLAGGDMKPLATSDDLDTIILFSYRWPLPSAMTSTRATTCCLVLGGINDGKIPSERYGHCGSRRGATRADEARSGVPSLGYVPSRPGRCCLVRAVLGEEEAEVDPIGSGNPKGGGGMGFLVEEVVLSDSGGGLRFRQNMWTLAEVAALGAMAGWESGRQKRILTTVTALWAAET